MRDFRLDDAVLDPRRGPGAVLNLGRRGLRKLIRPLLVRIAEVLNSLADRIDAVEGRLHPTASRTELALDKIRHGESRADQAELRLDELERVGGLVWQRTEGMGAHLQGLTDDHRGLTAEYRDLCARFESRVVQLTAVAHSVEGLDRDQAEIKESLRAFTALHWDHVALARRLAAIEDRLAGESPDAAGDDDRGPSITFPGFDDRSRARAG